MNPGQIPQKMISYILKTNLNNITQFFVETNFENIEHIYIVMCEMVYSTGHEFFR